MKLDGKVAVVTGGAMGNGLGIVKIFLKYGAKVAILDYDDEINNAVRNYMTIPFEQDIYARYLESVINCDVSIKGYSKGFNQVLKELNNWIYPMMPGSNTYRPPAPSYNSTFSPSMNNTLNQMKRKY